MFLKKFCINFTLLLFGIHLLFLQVNALPIAIPTNVFQYITMGFDMLKRVWEYGDIFGFGEKDPNNATTSAEYTVIKMAKSIGLPINTEKFENLHYKIVLQFLMEKLEKGEVKIPGHTSKEVLDKINELEKQRSELQNKLDEEEKDNEGGEEEEIIKKLSGEVNKINKLVDELEGIIKKVLEVARKDALNASAAAEFYVKKLGSKIIVRFSNAHDEYMRRKVNEVDDIIVVKVYTENEKALREKLEKVSEMVTFEQIYDKVFDVVNKEKKLRMWDAKRNAGYDLPMEKVKGVLEKVKVAKAELDKHIGHLKSDEIKKREEISHTYAQQVKALNNAVKELAKIAEG